MVLVKGTSVTNAWAELVQLYGSNNHLSPEVTRRHYVASINIQNKIQNTYHSHITNLMYVYTVSS